MSDEYEYDGQEYDFHYESSGANHSEKQHEEHCNWLYGNCNCKQSREDYL
jgi:hypothetical protein